MWERERERERERKQENKIKLKVKFFGMFNFLSYGGKKMVKLSKKKKKIRVRSEWSVIHSEQEKNMH